jgi:predicted DNA-binding transcriptional regulator YafY
VRADRLVAMLLLLQRRGKVTAAEAAAELEVSERTARRDLDALGMAGLPVYSTRGRNGGWGLVGGGRTDLSGLTQDEVRTLFLLAGPSSSATPEIRAALRKLVRALPESFRDTAEAASRAVVVDQAGWDSGGSKRPDPPHLEAVQQAVVEGHRTTLGYVAGNGEFTTRVVDPLGLAVKGSVWYLVAGTEHGQRTFRVDRIRTLEVSDDLVVRPEGFDLTRAWESITKDVDERRTPARARAIVNPDSLSLLRWVFARRLRIGPPYSDGRVEIELRSANTRALAGEIAGFGGTIEVLEPQEIREHLREIAHELSDLYGPNHKEDASR